MPKYTEHYNLKKPLQEEFYDIDDHNGNMDIIDSVLKLLSEDSGVVISPDEPEKGDVWIDTDDGAEGGENAVTSVNGKTGDVILTAKDLDVYTVGETYSKEEVHALLPTAYTHPATHPASMITETNAIKMFLAEEREKLAGIEYNANKYIHPDTHPASMITGLEEAIDGFGYSKLIYGSYTGNAQTSSASNGYTPVVSQTITLPVKINYIVILFDSIGVLQHSCAVGKTIEGDNGYTPIVVDSSGTSFTVEAKGGTASYINQGTNGRGTKWYYLAF